MPRISEHERSGTIATLQAWVHVSHVTRCYNCHPSTIQRLKDASCIDDICPDRLASVQDE